MNVTDETGTVEAGVTEAVRARAAVIRRPPPAHLAAIDVGTNSIHLVIAEISPDGDFQILGRDKEMVQLGQGGFRDHILTPRAVTEGLETLKRFVKMAQLRQIQRIKAYATSAVRESRNGGDFVKQVRETVGLDLRVISAEEEARLIYLAVRHAVPLDDADNLIFDIGGGSIELIVGNAQRAEAVGSVKLGASRLAELFIRSDPPKESDLKAMRDHIAAHLEPWAAKFGRRTFARCIGTSGTIRCIANLLLAPDTPRLDDDPLPQLHIQRADLKPLIAKLGSASREERLKMPGMESRRVDMVLAGAVVLHALLRAFDATALEHCELAMREGIILDHIARHRAHLLARATWPDPRMRSVIHLAERCGYRRHHAEKTAELAVNLFDQLEPLHRLDPSYRELLRYGCLLHDIGYHIGHRNHHKHSYYLIRNGELKGFDEQEIEVIANVARYHRKGRPKKAHYSFQNLRKEHRKPARKLSVLLRIANALDRTHYGVVESVECVLSDDRVELRVRSGQDAELELWTAERQAEVFEKEFAAGLTVRLADTGEMEADRVSPN